ncbi:hypothetical protein [Ilumatobacter sp.]|uniref:hypothetical protein n=6 Tax=Ilumatobacter sp. TaxID=1967498 RepID=UPI003296A08C
MTEQGGAWERLDAAAATPRSVGSSATASSAGSGALRRVASSFRLRRSRGPSLASLDGGGSILQRRLRDVMLGATVILVPAVALNVWVTVLGYDRLDPNDSAVPSFLGDDTGGGIEDLAVWTSIVFASLVTAVVGYFAAQILLGERFRSPVTLATALKRTGRRLPSITVAWMLTHWWFPIMALIVVTAEVDLVGLWLFLFTFVAWFSSAATLFVIPAMVGERLGPLAAAKRNWRLVRLRYGLCVVFVMLATLLSVLLLVGIATLVPLLEQFGFLELGSAGWIVQSVMLQLAVLVVVPLIALGTAQAYLEVRLAAEGLDLQIDADRAFGPSTVEVVG